MGTVGTSAMPGPRTLVLLFVALLGMPSHCNENHFNPIRSELKYIACEVCEETAAALHGNAEELRAAKGNKLSEEAIGKVVEDICQPDPNQLGAWILNLDIIERDGSLKLRKHKEQGACRRECKTIATSCQDLLDNLDDIDELVVALWKGGKKKKQIKQLLCSAVCARKVAKFTAKRTNEKFTTKEQALADQLARMKRQQARDLAQQKSNSKKKASEPTPSLWESLSAALGGMTGDGISSVRENGLWMWTELAKHTTAKQIRKYGKELYQDMKRDLYDKSSWKRSKRQFNWLWEIHQPAALWKDSSTRTTLHIMAGLIGFELLLEGMAFGLSRAVCHSSRAGKSIVGASVLFFATCAIGLYFKL